MTDSSLTSRTADSPVFSPLSSPGGFPDSQVPNDVLKDVVAYVEVRTASDNRSAAIKRVLERMGAKVEDKFTNDVTHVIFKEGKKRTVVKAKKNGVRLVSVLWIDRCKELQQKVPEEDFPANTERCGTPPPGIRWKKYKSMQPRDFEDEVARSAERLQKRNKKRVDPQHLLQGAVSATPFHSTGHVLVVDTQPRSPFEPRSFSFHSPVIIPNTPPSMQARLEQILREKEARRRGEVVESPLVRNGEPPLQRTLFTSCNTTNEEDSETSTSECVNPNEQKPGSSGHRRLSSIGDDRSSSAKKAVCTEPKTIAKERSVSSESVKTSSVSRLHSAAEDSRRTSTGTSKYNANNSPVTQLENSTRKRKRSPERATEKKRDVDRQQKKNEGSQPLQSTNRTPGRRASSRHSLPPQRYSQMDEEHSQTLSQSLMQSRDVHEKSVLKKIRASPRHSLGNCLPSVALVRLEDESGSSTSSGTVRTDAKNVNHSGKNITGDSENRTALLSGRDKPSNSKQKPDGVGLPASINRNKSNSNISSVRSASQGDQSAERKSGTHNEAGKSTARKRKLLNPYDDMQVLSPSPTENQTVSVTEETLQKGGKKRKSFDVSAVFPSSSVPVPRRGRGSGSSKENKSARRSSSQGNGETSRTSVDKDSKKKVRSKKTEATADESSISNSTLNSTSQASSILGASMSMMFGETSALGGLGKRLPPPRSSIAEFKPQKPRRQSNRSSSKLGSRWQVSERGGGLTGQQKSRPICMPSIVMTSMHRPEQEEVIVAVKKLGTFRIEDKVSKDTTHVVYGEARRTLNLLHGLARGCWIVDREWVTHSAQAGKWLAEDDFEANNEDIPKAKEARLMREADPSGTYQCRMFDSAGSFFVSNTCTPPRAQMLKLLNVCGAKVTESIHRADFYIGDQIHEEKTSVKPIWILDCMSQQQLLPMEDYILAVNSRPKSGSSPEY